ncbi:MAG: putative nucleic-acid-binding Zn-ribbon protein [Oceanicoccus sp.]|jgi:predicted nucleic-acid-binding Zn-ribbon protein
MTDPSQTHMSFKCLKCGNTNAELGEFRAAGGFWSKIFDVQGAKFSTVTCTNCQYTEIYKKLTSTASNVLDFFTN